MDFKKIIEQLENSEIFKEWKQKHNDYYLAHFFMIPEDNPSWQIGFSDGEKVTTFTLDPIKYEEHNEINKNPNSKINPLDITDFKYDFKDIKNTFEKTISKKYPKENIFKTIIIIQNIDGNNLYNITGLTHSFKTLNIKINNNCEIISDSLIELISKNNN